MNSAQILNFSLTSSEARAWLVINGNREEPRVGEMWNGYACHWTTTAWLRPGGYRCRYHCGDDAHIVYHGPARLDGETGNEMDERVAIESPTKRNPLPIRILLVEDNITTLNACAKLLRADGYTVYLADGYQSGLAVAKKETLHLAICDINLWDGDGCDLLRELKLLHPIKAIAMTGYTLPEETEHYRDAGFSVVLRKPVHHSEIVAAISQLNDVPAPVISGPLPSN
jgi:CheY-like chemotaxis protein